MAEGHTAGKAMAHGHMDIRQNEETWHMFTKMVFWITAFVVVLVALLGYFLV